MPQYANAYLDEGSRAFFQLLTTKLTLNPKPLQISCFSRHLPQTFMLFFFFYSFRAEQPGSLGL